MRLLGRTSWRRRPTTRGGCGNCSPNCRHANRRCWPCARPACRRRRSPGASASATTPCARRSGARSSACGRTDRPHRPEPRRPSVFDDEALPREAVELDRFWNDLLAGQRDPAGYALEAEMAETVQWVQRGLRPPADAATSRRLDQRMAAALVRPRGVAPHGRPPHEALVRPPAGRRAAAGGTVVAWLTTA